MGCSVAFPFYLFNYLIFPQIQEEPERDGNRDDRSVEDEGVGRRHGTSLTQGLVELIMVMTSILIDFIAM